MEMIYLEWKGTFVIAGSIFSTIYIQHIKLWKHISICERLKFRYTFLYVHLICSYIVYKTNSHLSVLSHILNALYTSICLGWLKVKLFGIETGVTYEKFVKNYIFLSQRKIFRNFYQLQERMKGAIILSHSLNTIFAWKTISKL